MQTPLRGVSTNAAPLYRVTAETKPNAIGGGNTTTITLLTRPKDTYHFPLKGQVVEILPWSAVLSNGEKVAAQSGFLTTVAESYDPDPIKQTLILKDALPADFGADWKNRTDKTALTTAQFNAQLESTDTKQTKEFFYMRVWNRGTEENPTSEITFALNGNPTPLGNTGIAIKIEGTEALKEDFWVIAARPETKSQVSPWALETGIGPHRGTAFFRAFGDYSVDIAE